MTHACDLTDEQLSEALTAELGGERVKAAAHARRQGIGWSDELDPDETCRPLGLWALLAEYKRRHKMAGRAK